MPEQPERPRSRQDIPRMGSKVNQNISFTTVEHANLYTSKSNSSILTMKAAKPVQAVAQTDRTKSMLMSINNQTS